MHMLNEEIEIMYNLHIHCLWKLGPTKSTSKSEFSSLQILASPTNIHVTRPPPAPIITQPLSAWISTSVNKTGISILTSL